MQDIVFPRGNERNLIKMAKKLGFDSLIFVYDNKDNFFKETADIPVINGLLTQPKKVKQLKSNNIFTICKGTRDAIESGCDLVFDFEGESRRDKTHYRRSGLNQVLCKLARKKKVAIGFDLSRILNATSKELPILLGRIMQNIALCEHFKVSIKVGSFASSKFDMRSPKDLVSLFVSLGLSSKKVAD